MAGTAQLARYVGGQLDQRLGTGFAARSRLVTDVDHGWPVGSIEMRELGPAGCQLTSRQ